ncbi:hypothetical protein IB241_14715 [Pseudomonas sp. PDM05]|jgi:DNA replicative helicase MCM subunit Mcm2 (Cdc46/Mcm family)|uniref:hypothetical protein n=1 Tax=Pseudomonas sp. PDM05 TaxID=2769301 RepID=UPI00178490FC|nr:hypothetical protein [Pseudomonas sp. PDM05]MBD9458938.1 hypothetical protein [Pseudomonas sp. PDM05]
MTLASLPQHSRFDFLSLALDAQEHDIETALIKHVTDFLRGLEGRKQQKPAFQGRHFV